MKFKEWKVGQAWLINRGNWIYLLYFLRIEIKESKDFVGIDINENNVTLSLCREFIQIITHEREIRTAY